ncbi:MAG: MATE family efflux transporter [Lachnospiraceae bacterium]|nr:MATE family efflux transporter [Lachnospiraceae bacterium]
MNIQLSDHFTYKKLLRFTLPSVAMMVFTSIYGVVDGFFVSNYVGKIPFAAVNFIMPFLMILGAFGFMFGTGGSALISKTMGEGKREKANSLFTMLTLISFILGVVIAVLGILFIRPIASFLGAEGELLEQCVLYGRLILIALPAFMLQQEFQSFFVTAEKPVLGFLVTLVSGLTNMILDVLFIVVLKWDVAGAAVATAISQVVGGLFPLFYFARPNKSLLRFTRAKLDIPALVKTCTNGSSELMSNVSMSLVSMLYNVQLMKYAQENGVAAYGVLMYVSFIFISVFIGYSIGIAPVIGYHYGAGNHSELKSLKEKSLMVIGMASVGMTVLGEVLAKPLSLIFVGYDKELLDLTHRGFLIFSLSFLFVGIAIFGSGFFTALNNGLISALISFLRTLVFQIGVILILPIFWETDGIWISLVVAELMAAVVTVIFLIALRKKYQY